MIDVNLLTIYGDLSKFKNYMLGLNLGIPY